MNVEVRITHRGGSLDIERSTPTMQDFATSGIGQDLKLAAEMLRDIAAEVVAVARHHLPPEAVAVHECGAGCPPAGTPHPMRRA